MSSAAGTGAPAREVAPPGPPRPGRGPVRALVGWHVGIGELGLRLFLLHLLMVLGILAGGIVLGLAPALAAVHTELRGDERRRRIEAQGEIGEEPPPLWRSFWTSWRAEFVRANLLGGVLAIGWALLLVDRTVLAQTGGAATPWVSGVLVVLTVVLALVTAVVWPLAAHFSDPLPRILVMAPVLLVRRPVITLGTVGVLAVTVMVWQAVPGLAPVFGVLLPCWAVTALCWRTGSLPTA